MKTADIGHVAFFDEFFGGTFSYRPHRDGKLPYMNLVLDILLGKTAFVGPIERPISKQLMKYKSIALYEPYIRFYILIYFKYPILTHMK